MDFLLLALLCVSLQHTSAMPHHYPLYKIYVAQPAYVGYNYHPLVAPESSVAQSSPLARLPTPAPLTTLVHNSISYRVDADSEPDDALEVAQFHSQDAAGRVVFGFNTPDQTRMEARALDGSVRGSYSYQDPTGKIVKMHYWDDGMGFHTVGNNLPASYFSTPQYTPEVQAARAQHFHLYRQALAAALATGGEYFSEPQPEPSAVGDETEAAAVTPPKAPASEHNSPQESETHVDLETPTVTADSSPDQMSDSGAPDYDSDSDTVAIESAELSWKMAAPVPDPKHVPLQRRTEPEANRKQVAEVTDLTLDPSQLAIARTGVDGYQYLIPVAGPLPGQSESLYAARYGAIPVAAVHDAQVSPTQRENIADHQLKPILVRTGLARSA